MWSDAYLESRVLSADPIELVRMLYQGAIEAVRDARRHLAAGEIAARSAAITKCAEILGELSASLNLREGGEIGRNLARLYTYMQERLLEANLRQADEPLAETLGLLATLAAAWDAVPASQAQAGYDCAPELEGFPPAAYGMEAAASGAGQVWTL